MELTDNDVLLGRGAVNHKGNLQFREIIAGRKSEYLNVRKRQHKDWIARQVMSAVAKKGGRFLQRIESKEEAQKLGILDEKTAWKVGWKVADKESVLLKIKQALRERDTEPVHKRTKELSSQPSKKHQPDTPLKVSAGLEMQQSQSRNEPSWMESPPQASMTGLASGAPSTQETSSLLSGQYEQLLQQFRNRQPSSLIPDMMRPQEALLLGTSLQQLSSLYPRSNVYPDDLGYRAHQHSAHTHDPHYGSLGQSSSETSPLDNLLVLLNRYGQPDIPPTVASLAPSILASYIRQQAPKAARLDSDPASLQINQAPAESDSAFASGSNRFQALLTALQGSNDTERSISGGPIFPRQEERINPHSSLIGEVYQNANQFQQPSGRTIPSFFPQDLLNETNGIVTLYNSTSLDHQAQGSINLSFSLTEMLILSVLCSFGIPTWCPSKLDRSEVFSPMKKPDDNLSTYQINWYEYSLLLHEASKNWRDRQNQISQTMSGILAKIQSKLTLDLENHAVAICASYSTNCRQLAKTTLCVLEKLRCFLKAMRGESTGASQKATVPPADDPSTCWMEKEIQLWAETLECHNAKGFPVAYTASDFLASHPEHKENSAFMLVSNCDLEASEIIWRQIVVLSHTRSMATALNSVDDLSVKLERSLMYEDARSWKGMPRWWSVNSLYFDTELLKIVLLNGYVGVLTAPLPAPRATASIHIEPMTFAKLGITNKRLLQERFEQLAGYLAKTEDDVTFFDQLQQPWNQKCLNERILAFQDLA